MRVLVVGAGGIGGYFGGRLLQAGRDVTFLVRPRRAHELADGGLVINSRYGNATISHPPTVLTGQIQRSFDLVMLSCKAYDLDGAIEAVAPAIGPGTTILPLLNGMRHLDVLDQRFRGSRVLGALCMISVALDREHAITHLSGQHTLAFGERNGGKSERTRALEELMGGAQFDAQCSVEIILEMWEKWIFIATLAGMTCLMRAPIGNVLRAADGAQLILGLLEECRAIADAAGYAPRPASLEKMRATLTTPDSPLAASMLRDIESNSLVEADHILGDLLSRERAPAAQTGTRSLLRVAYAHLQTYQAGRG